MYDKKSVSWEKRTRGSIRLLSHGVIMKCLEKETLEHKNILDFT